MFEEMKLMSPEMQRTMKDLCDWARSQAEQKDVEFLWKRALQDLALSADRLDAMIARTHVTNVLMEKKS